MMTYEQHKEIGKIKLPRNKISDFSMTDFFKSYKKHIGKNPVYKVEPIVYSTIIQMYLKKMVEQLLLQNKPIQVQPSIGPIKIRRNKHNVGKTKRYVNYAETKKRGFTVYYTNEHTNGDYFITEWKKTTTIPFISHYCFKFCKAIKKRMSDNIINNICQYY